jgi:hypothetical protein
VVHLLGRALKESPTATHKQSISREKRRAFVATWIFDKIQNMASGVAGGEMNSHFQATNAKRVSMSNFV